MAQIINFSICLSSIPKELIKNVNGKCYLQVTVFEKKQTDNYQNTHHITINMTDEQKKKFPNTIFLGSGREYGTRNVNTQANNTISPPVNIPPVTDYDNDLPF